MNQSFPHQNVSPPHFEPSNNTFALVTGSNLLWFITTGLLCSIGTVANFFLLSILVVHKKLRRGSGIIITHLNLLYFLICTACIPLQLIQVASYFSVARFFTPNCRFFHFVY